MAKFPESAHLRKTILSPSQRDALAAKMVGLLNGAEFNGQAFSDAQAQSLIAQGQALLGQANGLPH